MISFTKEKIQDLFSDDKIIQTTSVLTTILTLTFFYIKFKSKSSSTVSSENDWSSLYSSDATSSPIKEPELKNVFDVKQDHPLKNHSSSNNTGTTEKPFSSSYYYAHNNPNTIGGYKDGLKAEDYVMNGPKLLSKVSKPKETTKPTTSTQAATIKKQDSIPITRYLWDDDGNSNGIAKIIIDTLPSSGISSTNLAWENSGIVSKEDVRAKLSGVWKNGLIVQIRRNLDEEKSKRYHLYVPRLFGEVENVALIVKSKKLIIKLYKKNEKENLKAWPQLPSKVAASPENSIFDEDLFS